jgi:hypothetical protein
MKETLRTKILKLTLRLLLGVSVWVLSTALSAWIPNSPFGLWLENHNGLVLVLATVTDQIQIPTIFLLGLWTWFVLTFGLFVYVWRNFDFDDRKRERPTIADVIRYQEEIRKRISERKASEQKQ